MNLANLCQTSLVAIASASLGAFATLHKESVQESVRTKELVVEDSAGRPILQVGSLGMTLYGTEPEEKIFFKHMREQQIRFIRKGNALVLSVGAFRSDLAGIVNYSNWKTKSFFLSGGGRTVLSMVGSEDDRDHEQQFFGGIDGSHAARLSAKEDGAELQLGGLMGSTRRITHSSGD